MARREFPVKDNCAGRFGTRGYAGTNVGAFKLCFYKYNVLNNIFYPEICHIIVFCAYICEH